MGNTVKRWCQSFTEWTFTRTPPRDGNGSPRRFPGRCRQHLSSHQSPRRRNQRLFVIERAVSLEAWHRSLNRLPQLMQGRHVTRQRRVPVSYILCRPGASAQSSRLEARAQNLRRRREPASEWTFRANTRCPESVTTSSFGTST
jgi:hypothetical protein